MYSKVVAGKEVWRIHDTQSKWDLFIINPTLVFGPSLSPTTSESFAIMKQFGDGSIKSGRPKLSLGVVDVRDVAEAYIKAAFTSAAKGRYLVNGSNTTLLGIRKIRPEFNAYPLPKSEVPKALVWLVGPIMLKGMTRKFISQSMGYPFKADNSKSVKEFKLDYRPLHETVQEFFQEFIHGKQLKAR